MPQIALVAHKHYDNVTVRMIAQLLEPPLHVLIRRTLADVVDEQRANSATVVCGGDGTVAFLSGCIPDLSLDGLGVDLDGSSGKFNTDGRL